MSGAGLPLRDIHLPPTPGWWPPAPAWWLLAGLVLAAAGFVVAVLWRRTRRRRALLRMFDRHVAEAGTDPDRVAAISELLRRAARERDPAAATLEGTEWLVFLDRDASVPDFKGAVGELLLDGGYRREIDEAALDALHSAARARFLQLAGGRR